MMFVNTMGKKSKDKFKKVVEKLENKNFQYFE